MIYKRRKRILKTRKREIIFSVSVLIASYLIAEASLQSNILGDQPNEFFKKGWPCDIYYSDSGHGRDYINNSTDFMGNVGRDIPLIHLDKDSSVIPSYSEEELIDRQNHRRDFNPIPDGIHDHDQVPGIRFIPWNYFPDCGTITDGHVKETQKAIEPGSNWLILIGLFFMGILKRTK